jgi:Xaa-Pro aminopeptidase
VVDFGAMVDGYHSDMTRTFVVGEPTDEQDRMLTAVREAQAAGAAAAGPGVSTRAVDDRCREVLAEHGLADLFHHGTGHGVGLVIHESPMLGKTSTGELEPGNVITVEPGVYVAGLGGVRVEDTLVVTTDGARPLTAFPKDPRCLPSAPTTSRPA